MPSAVMHFYSGQPMHFYSGVDNCAAFMVTEAAPEPEQAPLQPVKVEPEAAAGVSVTEEPWSKFDAQLPALQLMPDGALVTVPEPVPATETVSACWIAVKVTVQARSCAMLKLSVIADVDGPVAEQEPVALVKVEFASGVCVSVSEVAIG